MKYSAGHLNTKKNTIRTEKNIIKVTTNWNDHKRFEQAPCASHKQKNTMQSSHKNEFIPYNNPGSTRPTSHTHKASTLTKRNQMTSETKKEEKERKNTDFQSWESQNAHTNQ